MVGNRPNCRGLAEQFSCDWEMIGDDKGNPDLGRMVQVFDDYEVDVLLGLERGVSRRGNKKSSALPDDEDEGTGSERDVDKQGDEEGKSATPLTQEEKDAADEKIVSA